MDLPDRLVVLGDSFTEGLHDELGPDGRHRGWADRVAAVLATRQPGLTYANLAVRGRLLDEVATEQLPAALDLRPQLVAFHAGANDVLRPRVTISQVARRYDRAVVTLREAGIEVLLFTVIEQAGGTGRLANGLARRFASFNAAVRATAARRGATLVDLGGVPALHDRRLWDEDRLHLSPAGHTRVAAAVLETLGVDDAVLNGGPAGWWRVPLPTVPEGTRRQKLAADLTWTWRHLAPWVWRRVRGVSSGDGVVAKRPMLVEVHRDDVA